MNYITVRFTCILLERYKIKKRKKKRKGTCHTLGDGYLGARKGEDALNIPFFLGTLY